LPTFEKRLLAEAVVEGAVEVPPRENDPPVETVVEAAVEAVVEAPEAVVCPNKPKLPEAVVGVVAAFSTVGWELAWGKLNAGLDVVLAVDEEGVAPKDCPPKLGNRLGFAAPP